MPEDKRPIIPPKNEPATKGGIKPERPGGPPDVPTPQPTPTVPAEKDNSDKNKK